MRNESYQYIRALLQEQHDKLNAQYLFLTHQLSLPKEHRVDPEMIIEPSLEPLTIGLECCAEALGELIRNQPIEKPDFT